MAAILQLSQYCTFRMDSISTVITEPGQPVVRQSPVLAAASSGGPKDVLLYPSHQEAEGRGSLSSLSHGSINKHHSILHSCLRVGSFLCGFHLVFTKPYGVDNELFTDSSKKGLWN